MLVNRVGGFIPMWKQNLTTATTYKKNRLFDAATAARVELTRAQQSHVNIPYITADQTGPKHLDVVLTRARGDRIIEPLLRKVRRAHCTRALWACALISLYRICVR